MTLTVSVDEVVEESNNPLLNSHNSWERIRLKEVADVLNGSSFSSDYFTKEKGIPLLRIRDIGDTTTEKNFSGKYEDKYVVHPGDLVVGMDGDFICDLWSGPKALLNQRVCKITPDEAVYNRKFLYYVLQPYLNAIHARTSATTVKHLSSTDVKDIPLPQPPISEQKQIVVKIEELFSKLDSGTNELENVNKQLKRYRRSIMKKAFRGGLTREYSDIRPENSVDQEFSSNNEDASFPKYSNRSKVPNQWHCASLEDVFSFRNGEGLPKDNRNPGNYPVYGGNGKTDTHDEWNMESSALVIGRVGANCGNVHISPPKSWITDNAIYTKEIKIEISLKYCWLLLSSYPLNSLSGGTGQSYISQKTLKSIDIPLPPISEQREIANRLDTQLSLIRNIKEMLSIEQQKSRGLRQAILKQAFIGKLVPQNQAGEPTKESSQSEDINPELGKQKTLSEVTNDVE